MTNLDPQAQAILDAGAASGLPPVYTIPTAEARKRMRAAFIKGEAPLVDRAEVSIPGPNGGLPARLYSPVGGQKLPLIVFFHGGGWTVNDLDTHDRLCDLIAAGSNSAVLSVDYRRAPEFPYPAALDDAYTALEWAEANAHSLGCDGQTFAVAGDSSGGTLAAALTLLSKHRRGPRISLQILLYPALDYLEPATRSYVERATGYSLNFDFMAWSWRNYLPEVWARDDQYLFPLQAPDLSGLPEALILTAEYDPLRDEGIAYANRLVASSTQNLVRHWHLDDQMHGFAMQTNTIDRAARMMEELTAVIDQRLHSYQRQLWLT